MQTTHLLVRRMASSLLIRWQLPRKGRPISGRRALWGARKPGTTGRLLHHGFWASRQTFRPSLSSNLLTARLRRQLLVRKLRTRALRQIGFIRSGDVRDLPLIACLSMARVDLLSPI